MMYLLITSTLFLLVVAYGIIEYRWHLYNLNSIPIRIHVNGTRGKSSVARLIAAALREHGIKAFAKTTGTLPRMVTETGAEYPIYRPGRANIIEQVRIVTFAAHHKAEALVIECMALQPLLQSMAELKLIRSTHGVITNIRADHLDVMGPQERDVAMALLGTTPRRAKLFTSELDYIPEMEMSCADRGSELVVATPEDQRELTDEEMGRFKYVEHRENVALALKVCESLSIPRETALRGMWTCMPDMGAMGEYHLSFFGREIVFVNGFAANDPESSESIWRMALDKHGDYGTKIMILNTRTDRADRSRQLGQAIHRWPLADKYILIGDGTYQILRYAIGSGMEPALFVNAEGMTTERTFEEILFHAGKSALIMGLGNIAGPGMELLMYFRNRGTLYD